MKGWTINYKDAFDQLKQQMIRQFLRSGKISLCSRYKKNENKRLLRDYKGGGYFPKFIIRKSYRNMGIESEQLYQSGFLKASQPMWITDRHTLKIIEVNEAAIIYFGISKEEFLRRTAFDIMDYIDVTSTHGPMSHNSEYHLVVRTHYLHAKGFFSSIDMLINNVYFKGKEVYLITHQPVDGSIC